MAIITKLDYILNLELGDKGKSYLQSLKDENSAAVKRIYSLTPPSFVRYDISDDVFAMEQTFVTKDRKDCFFESHKTYADVQIVLGGTEMIEMANTADLIVDKDYDADKDLITYKDYSMAHRLVMGRFDAAIFFPDDAHLCVSQFKCSERVYKTVLKVPVSMFM